MFSLNDKEKDRFISLYTSQLIGNNPKKQINQILETMKYNFKNNKAPDFDGKIFNIKITFHNLSDNFNQLIIETRYRDDRIFRMEQKHNHMEDQLYGIKIHSRIAEMILPVQTRKLLKDIQPDIKFNNNQLLFANINYLVPAIVVYTLYHYDNIEIPYQLHLMNKAVCNTDQFLSTFELYLNIESKLTPAEDSKKSVTENKPQSKPIETSTTDLDISSVSLTETEKNKIKYMTPCQTKTFVERKLLLTNHKSYKTRTILNRTHKQVEPTPTDSNKSNKPTDSNKSNKPTKPNLNIWKDDDSDNTDIGQQLYPVRHKKYRPKLSSLKQIGNKINKLSFSFASLSEHY
jgi:hypothetical protein